MPIGRPSLLPQGRLIAGWPVTLIGQVLRVASQLRRVTSCGGEPGGAMGVAYIGVVGSSSR